MKTYKLGKRDEPAYRIEFHPAAEKEFFDLPPQAQTRFEKAIDGLEVDPFTPRPGVGVLKLADLSDGSTLHRLRVGERRACYGVVTAQKKVWVLLFDDREVGYRRMQRTAEERYKRRT
ncbi:MAG: type II toxin-antitoxin system RelE family toxin [Thermoplasmatota archaeon]